MTANEYQKLALRTEKTPDFYSKVITINSMKVSRLIHAAMGMQTEAGELTDMLKKHIMYGKTLDEVNVVEEAADQLWYIAIALDAVGVSLEDAMARNIKKLSTRYPEKFTEHAALNRDLDAERAALEGK
jgi:NTP pyrophosphatase (non-canonical NTP hydrolase)